MNTVLLNDTRSDDHIGCELVIKNTFLKCSQVGLNIIATVPTSEASRATEILAPYIPSSQLVLLNGEGTLHDDKPNALSLLAAAKSAKDAGLVVILYNALWLNNIIGKKYLPVFDFIFCRDQSSLTAVLKDYPDADAQVVPDMTFATQFPANIPAARKGVLVTDSVRKKKCIKLAKLALKHDFELAPMGTAFFKKLKKHPILKWRLKHKLPEPFGTIDTVDIFLTKLLSAEAIVTGRFHTVCLAILCNTPVYSISSNTPKIHNLLEYFGLDSSRTDHEIPPTKKISTQWQEHKDKEETTQAKVAEAQLLIHAMFDSIKSTAIKNSSNR